MSAAYQLPWDFQLSGSFLATPGPSVAANYTVTAAHRRPADHRLDRRRHDDRRQPRRAEHGVPRLQEAARPAHREELPLRQHDRVQGFADIFNLLNAGTVLRVNETYGANPATNAWLTPTTIMDARYLRFGMQMSF